MRLWWVPCGTCVVVTHSAGVPATLGPTFRNMPIGRAKVALLFRCGFLQSCTLEV